MKSTVVEISIGTMVNGELRQASAEVEVPDFTSWDDATDLASAFGAAYARLWGVPSSTVHTGATIVQVERSVLRSGDVPCDGRLPRSRKV